MTSSVSRAAPAVSSISAPAAKRPHRASPVDTGAYPLVEFDGLPVLVSVRARRRALPVSSRTPGCTHCLVLWMPLSNVSQSDFDVAQQRARNSLSPRCSSAGFRSVASIWRRGYSSLPASGRALRRPPTRWLFADRLALSATSSGVPVPRVINWPGCLPSHSDQAMAGIDSLSLARFWYCCMAAFVHRFAVWFAWTGYCLIGSLPGPLSAVSAVFALRFGAASNASQACFEGPARLG